MGYTHYFSAKKDLDEKEFKCFVNDCKNIVKQAEKEGIKLANWNGIGDPALEHDQVCFNGQGDDGYETFRIERVKFQNFCKTYRKPYDVV